MVTSSLMDNYHRDCTFEAFLDFFNLSIDKKDVLTETEIRKYLNKRFI